MTIAKQDGPDKEEAMTCYHEAYRRTPHPARNFASYQLLKNRDVRKLDHFPTQENDSAVDSCKRN